MPRRRSSRAWMFTINNPTDLDYELVALVVCLYIVFQTERGHGNGTLHIQGFIYFKEVKSMPQMSAMFPRAAFYISNKPLDEQIAYPQKLDTRVPGPAGERGTRPAQGKDAAFKDMLQDIRDGFTDVQMMEKYTNKWAHYYRVLIKYREDIRPYRTSFTKAVVLWGGTGEGKSTLAHHMANTLDPEYGVFMVQEKGRAVWLDGVIASPYAVLDDYEAELPYKVFLQLVDKHRCRVPVKHGSAKWNAKAIFITSNTHPREWYPNQGGPWGPGNPLHRRLTTHGSFIRRITAKPEIEAPPTPMEVRRDNIHLAVTVNHLADHVNLELVD